jgi:hypothetical protein
MIDTVKIKRTLKKSEKLAEIYGCRLNLGFSGGKDLHGKTGLQRFENCLEEYMGKIK